MDATSGHVVVSAGADTHQVLDDVLGSRFFERDRAELLAAARRQADEFGWGDLVAVRDDPAEVVAFIASHDPDLVGAAAVERRQRHRDPR